VRDQTTDIAARPSEAGDKTKLDRVIARLEHDRDRRGGSFGRDRLPRQPARLNGAPSPALARS
jgi:hypothetical protein